MSQQGFTIVSLQGVDMGDFEFIQEKALAGDTFHVSGDISALNNTIEFIVPSGKTAFITEAKITLPINPDVNPITNPVTLSNNQTVAELLIDTVSQDKAKIGVSSRGGLNAGNGISFNSTDRFIVWTLFLVGDGIKKIEIKNVLDTGGNAFATMSGYLV